MEQIRSTTATVKNYEIIGGTFYDRNSITVNKDIISYTTKTFDGITTLYEKDKAWKTSVFPSTEYPKIRLKEGNIIETETKDFYQSNDKKQKYEIETSRAYYGATLLNDNTFIYTTEEGPLNPIYITSIDKKGEQQKLKVKIPNRNENSAPGIYGDGNYTILITDTEKINIVAYKIET